MPRYNIEAIVLKSVNYGDAHKMFTLFTKQQGKIGASARGVRKITSKRSGNLDTLNHITCGISESNSGHKTITEVKTLNSFINLKSDFDSSHDAYYLIELVHKFIEEEDPSPVIFELLVRGLKKLSEESSSNALVTAIFEVYLMRHLGYGLQLDRCTVCDRPFSSEWVDYKFNYGTGGFVCEKCVGGFPISKPAAELLFAIDKSPKDLLENGEQDPDILHQVSGLIKNHVQGHLTG